MVVCVKTANTTIEACVKYGGNELAVRQKVRGEAKMSDGEKIKNCRQILDIV